MDDGRQDEEEKEMREKRKEKKKTFGQNARNNDCRENGQWTPRHRNNIWQEFDSVTGQRNWDGALGTREMGWSFFFVCSSFQGSMRGPRTGKSRGEQRPKDKQLAVEIPW